MLWFHFETNDKWTNSSQYSANLRISEKCNQWLGSIVIKSPQAQSVIHSRLSTIKKPKNVLHDTVDFDDVSFRKQEYRFQITLSVVDIHFDLNFLSKEPRLCPGLGKRMHHLVNVCCLWWRWQMISRTNEKNLKLTIHVSKHAYLTSKIWFRQGRRGLISFLFLICLLV